jgi:Holliday junction resolvase
MEKSKRAKSWTATRIESWAVPGVPDVDVCDEHGRFHKIELKSTASDKVGLRPHQVSYMTRHQHASCWILVRKTLTTGGHAVFLYHARQAVDVWAEGCKVRPILRLDSPVDYDVLFDTISPPEG